MLLPIVVAHAGDETASADYLLRSFGTGASWSSFSSFNGLGVQSFLVLE